MRHILLFLLAFPLLAQASIQGLRERLTDIIGDNDVSVALLTAAGDTLGIRSDENRELASVMKFFQAAALTRVLSYGAMMEDTVEVTAHDLHKNTWSPLRASVSSLPVSLPPIALLDYSLIMSDNNAADILFDRYASPAKVDSIVRKTYHIDNFSIRHTEDAMHRNPALSAENFTSAATATGLIYKFFTADTTSAATVIKAVMSRETPFGANRIPAGISKNAAKVFHKTGTGFTDSQGRISAVNDLAFISYPRPQGYSCYALGIFIANFDGTTEEAEKLIADISNTVWSAVIVDEFIALNKSASDIPQQQRQDVRPVGDNAWQAAVFDAVVELILYNLDK